MPYPANISAAPHRNIPSKPLPLSSSSMASSLLFLPFLFSFLLLSLSQTSSLVLPLTKHHSTLQYLTTLSYGSPLEPTNLVLDLGGSALWLDCSSRNMPSSSSQIIPRRSIQCLTANPHEFESLTPSDSPDQEQACRIFLENTITGTRGRGGELVHDLVTLRSTEDEESNTGNIQMLFSCSPDLLLNGLASGAKGMVGLGRTQSSLASQILTIYNTQRKFSLCLSSSTGVALFGNMATESRSRAEIFRSLTFTPLITPKNQKQPSREFLISVNSIKINGKRLTLNDGEGIQTQVSSVVPYTTMESSIYATFKEAFLKAAASMGMSRVAPVEPFEICFSSKGIDWWQEGSNVPVIELVLQSEMVKWRIHGRNSMVVVSGEVMCLGFVDGGFNPRDGIVIGGYQLEDVIVQFDLDTSMVGFSPSLLLRNTSCSDFKFGYMPSESV